MQRQNCMKGPSAQTELSDLIELYKHKLVVIGEVRFLHMRPYDEDIYDHV